MRIFFIIKINLLILWNFSFLSLFGDENKKIDNLDMGNPLASELAQPGGKISMFLAQYPKSFNYLIDHTQSSSEIFDLMFQKLIGLDPINLNNSPELAERWEISDDKLEFTFYLDKTAKWSDGEQITADDVIWTFNAVKNPKHLTGPLQVILGRLKSAEKIDKFTVKFIASEVHWKNLLACSSFHILPKHWWDTQEDFNKVNFKFDVVAGPYKIKELKEQHYVRLEKLSNFWGKGKKSYENIYNFDEVEFRFYSTRDVAYEAFKKGKIDIFAVYTSRRWMKETLGDAFEKNWIVKQSVHNYDPVGFQGFAMNMRKSIFKDKDVRLALGHLLNRDRMNKTLMYNQYALLNSYYPDLWNSESPSKNKMINYDPKKAESLLKSAGWKVNAKTGILEKDGREFVIKFLTRDPSSNKFLHIYNEDLKNAGIKLEIIQKDWAAWVKDMDEYNFDMTWAAWGASVFKDPEPMWHSKHTEIKAGNNITGFKNKKVDELIEKSTKIFDINKRHNIVREIDKILNEEIPYVLLWNIDYTRILFWNKFGMPDHMLGKYGDEFGVLKYWWNDEDQIDDLNDSKENGESLPKRSNDIYFDKVYNE